MSDQTEFDEQLFARRLCHALDQHAAALPAATRGRLADARRRAMARKKAAAPVLVRVPALATAGGSTGVSDGPGGRHGARRLAALAAALAIGAALLGLGNVERQQRIDDYATLDAQMLSDALPIDAYLDHGFNGYLKGDR
ncbi:DUF3619 family protein [Chitinasiproducens palmae]|uniref:DUF3619 family protein n=1 Tax=Chitinasiproducens palmae TaxID=1770053 RepID=A0A1H2PUH7_9BURK|nr:DUF3619 family protein [Chitinasiproducens palmae]SDV50030.1 Protein of unknown function [Chitinasiproducens palmae]